MSIEFIPRPENSYGRSKEFGFQIRERRRLAHPAAEPWQPFVAPALDVAPRVVNFGQEIP